MTDQNLRDFLERMATEEPVQFLDAVPLVRRARRRAARSVAVGAIGVAAAIALVFAGMSQLPEASPRIPVTVPTAAPRPSPAPGFSTFSSPLHGITIDYPAGWEVRPATEPWNHGTVTFDASNVDVIFDPRVGGLLYEVTDEGTAEWARITAWEPPHRLAMEWLIGKASGTEVEVRFSPEGPGSRVELEHRGWECIPDATPEFEGYSTGWDAVLSPYVESASKKA